MWSKPLLWRFRQSKEIPQTQVSQGFAAFHIAPPGYRHGTPKASALPTALIPDLVIEFCARCGQTCGQAVFLTISACGGRACIAGVSRDCGHCISRLEGGATCSQSRRATNCATPRYEVRRSGWAYSPKASALPTALIPDMKFRLIRRPDVLTQECVCKWLRHRT